MFIDWKVGGDKGDGDDGADEDVGEYDDNNDEWSVGDDDDFDLLLLGRWNSDRSNYGGQKCFTSIPSWRRRRKKSHKIKMEFLG